jgi:hypothetical protein
MRRMELLEAVARRAKAFRGLDPKLDKALKDLKDHGPKVQSEGTRNERIQGQRLSPRHLGCGHGRCDYGEGA